MVRKQNETDNGSADFVFLITGWTPSYFLGLSPIDREIDWYLETRGITLSCDLLRSPRRGLHLSGVSIRFLYELNASKERATRRVLGLGAFHVTKNVLQINIHAPAEMQGPLQQAIDAKKLRFLAVSVERAHYREGRVLHYSFSAVDEDEENIIL